MDCLVNIIKTLVNFDKPHIMFKVIVQTRRNAKVERLSAWIGHFSWILSNSQLNIVSASLYCFPLPNDFC